MARLLTVVNERKRLRILYRQHLEDEYIKSRKAEEQKEMLENREKLREKGVTNLPLTAEEMHA